MNVKVKEGDIYEIVVMAYGQTSDVEIWVELQNCIIHATDPPSLPCNDLALNRSITSDSSRNIRSVTFDITIDDAFIRLFGENETDISVTLYSGGKRGSNESANIHFVSNTMTENDPTDAPDCNTRVLPHTIDVTNYSNAQIDTQRSCSMKLGNVLPSAWLVSLCVSVLHFLSKLILEQF